MDNEFDECLNELKSGKILKGIQVNFLIYFIFYRIMKVLEKVKNKIISVARNYLKIAFISF